MTTTLIPGQLDLCAVQGLIKSKEDCLIQEESWAIVEQSFQQVKKTVDKMEVVYGINTGFGYLANQVISPEKLEELQKNIIVSHACGTGDLLDDETVSLIMLLKINSLAQGYSGVSADLIRFFLTLFNEQIYPCIPAKGSVGASGDLVPLAHLSLPLVGLGNVRINGEELAAKEALEKAGIRTLSLKPKEGLALLNGLQVSTALCLQAYYKCETLFATALITGSLSVDAALGSDIPFDDRIQWARGHRSQREVASFYRQLLQGSEIRESHRQCSRVQDPYSLRCQPQIMGAVWRQMQFVRDTLQVEINSITDNPLVFSEDAQILSGGNFHGEMIAMAADNLALAIAEMGANAERRIALLIDKNFSNLPSFLVKEGGINSGFMIAHVTAAACASDNKALSHPHSVDSLPTSANQEDHVSMATNAARRLHLMLDNTATILAIEMLAACQGIEFRKPLKTSKILQQVHDEVRQLIPPYDRDRYFAPDIALIKEKISNDEFRFSRLMVESNFAF